MTSARVAVINLCKKELQNPGLPRIERENIIAFLKRQMNYDSYMKLFREVTDECFEQVADL